jgi:phage host-nuclease inhibitor protein Gam
MNKKVPTSLKTFEDVDKELLRLGQIKARLQHEDAVYNDQLQQLRETYDAHVNEDTIAAKLIQENIEKFCIQYKDEFEKRRSKELTHGTVGFRLGTPGVILLNRKYNWNTVLELIKKVKKFSFIRTKEEVNKDGILAEYAAGEIDDDRLAGIGLKIDAKENFSIEIKWDSLGE